MKSVDAGEWNLASDDSTSSERSRRSIFAKAIEIATAAQKASLQSVEADRRCAHLTAIARRAQDQADAVRDLAADLTRTASSVARVALEVCGFHGYREAYEATVASGGVDAGPSLIELDAFLQIVDNFSASGAAAGTARDGTGGTVSENRKIPNGVAGCSQSGAVVVAGGAGTGEDLIESRSTDDRKTQVAMAASYLQIQQPPPQRMELYVIGSDDGSRSHQQQRQQQQSQQQQQQRDDLTSIPLATQTLHSVSVPTIRLPCSLYFGRSTSPQASCTASAEESRCEVRHQPTRLLRLCEDLSSDSDASFTNLDDVDEQRKMKFRTRASAQLCSRGVKPTVSSWMGSCHSLDPLSSDSEVEDILLRTPALEKIRTIEKLSTDALDPELLQHHQSDQPRGTGGDCSGGAGRERKLSRTRDRLQRRSYSPLLDSNERNHYSVTGMTDSGRNSPKHIFIPITTESTSGSRLHLSATTSSVQQQQQQQQQRQRDESSSTVQALVAPAEDAAEAAAEADNVTTSKSSNVDESRSDDTDH